jgi:hypothetical protein
VGCFYMKEQYDPALLEQLCEQARKEMDPQKLVALVKRINALLDEKEKSAADLNRKQSA